MSGYQFVASCGFRTLGPLFNGENDEMPASDSCSLRMTRNVVETVIGNLGLVISG
jgi:hypothetical protein